MAEPVGIDFSDREEWHRWLHENSSTQEGIWVVIQKKGSRKTGLRLEEAVDEAVCFGWIDGGMRSVDDDSFILRFSPRRRNSIWSLRNVERAEMMIEVGRMTEAGLEAIEEAKRDGRWETAYTSKVEPEVPEELERALRESPKAWENFKDFPNSTKLQYVHWVVTAKREKTRLRRISEVVRRAAKSIRPS